MLVLLCYLLLYLCGTTFFMACQAQSNSVRNIYVFGDSIVDGGQKGQHETTGFKAGYTPYGMECIWTGSSRFTNGQTIPEIIASALGLPAPVSTDESNFYPNSGIDYASASAGILPETGSTFGKNYCMEKQVSFFKETVENSLRPKFQSEDKLYDYLSNSVFLIDIGTSDYIHNYLQPEWYDSSRRYNNKSFAEHLVRKLGNHLEDLYNLGARKMVVFQIGPLGCYPYMINKVKPRNTRCANDVNRLVSIFNDKLTIKLNELSEKLDGSAFVTARIFDLIRSMIRNPNEYGFEETEWPCCETEENGTGLCKQPDYYAKPLEEPQPSGQRAVQKYNLCLDLPPLNRSQIGKPVGYVCTERSIYLFFDEVHLTQAAYKVIVNRCLDSTSGGTCSPYGIRHLAEI